MTYFGEKFPFVRFCACMIALGETRALESWNPCIKKEIG